ncbi:MAG: hypothetical protein WCQ99_11555 [Pseudomonadota bacterium]
MSPKPPLISGRNQIKAFTRLGYHKELDRWTLKNILRDAEIDEETLK